MKERNICGKKVKKREEDWNDKGRKGKERKTGKK